MVWLNVDVDLESLDDDELIDEIESRGYKIKPDPVVDTNELLMRIWENRRLGKPFDKELDQYLYEMTGRVL